MTKTVCDFCNGIILNKEGTVFYYAKKKCRIAILEISVTRGVRWKEMDACPKCVKRFSAENCGDVQINSQHTHEEIKPCLNTECSNWASLSTEGNSCHIYDNSEYELCSDCRA